MTYQIFGIELKLHKDEPYGKIYIAESDDFRIRLFDALVAPATPGPAKRRFRAEMRDKNLGVTLHSDFFTDGDMTSIFHETPEDAIEALTRSVTKCAHRYKQFLPYG